MWIRSGAVRSMRRADRQLACLLAAIWTIFNAWCGLLWWRSYYRSHTEHFSRTIHYIVRWFYSLALLTLGAIWIAAAVGGLPFGGDLWPYWAVLPIVLGGGLGVLRLSKLWTSKR
mmetsp:Transcript_107076/g.341722  ORF Transcript_107076/g.341722 Transcript_107076/m.341722 type:complete len:115 (+) Transcript_107076:825-1169(+)